MKIRNQKITVRLQKAIVQDMRTTALMRSMDSATTGAAVVLPAGDNRQSCRRRGRCQGLKRARITLTAYTRAIGTIKVADDAIDLNMTNQNPLYMPNNTCAADAAAYLNEMMEKKDSVGSMVECIITGVPAGVGEPVFDKLDAKLAQAVMSIGAVKAIEIGDGTAVVSSIGSENNDNFYMDGDTVKKRTNHSGGTLGGMSDGSPILIRASFKPTPSIFQAQDTVTRAHEEIVMEIKGRHDPIIGPRAVVVVESMCAITVLDLLMQNATAKLDNLKRIYRS